MSQASCSSPSRPIWSQHNVSSVRADGQHIHSTAAPPHPIMQDYQKDPRASASSIWHCTDKINVTPRIKAPQEILPSIAPTVPAGTCAPATPNPEHYLIFGDSDSEDPAREPQRSRTNSLALSSPASHPGMSAPSSLQAMASTMPATAVPATPPFGPPSRQFSTTPAPMQGTFSVSAQVVKLQTGAAVSAIPDHPQSPAPIKSSSAASILSSVPSQGMLAPSSQAMASNMPATAVPSIASVGTPSSQVSTTPAPAQAVPSTTVQVVKSPPGAPAIYSPGHPQPPSAKSSFAASMPSSVPSQGMSAPSSSQAMASNMPATAVPATPPFGPPSSQVSTTPAPAQGTSSGTVQVVKLQPGAAAIASPGHPQSPASIRSSSAASIPSSVPSQGMLAPSSSQAMASNMPAMAVPAIPTIGAPSSQVSTNPAPAQGTQVVKSPPGDAAVTSPGNPQPPAPSKILCAASSPPSMPPPGMPAPSSLQAIASNMSVLDATATPPMGAPSVQVSTTPAPSVPPTPTTRIQTPATDKTHGGGSEGSAKRKVSRFRVSDGNVATPQKPPGSILETNSTIGENQSSITLDQSSSGDPLGIDQANPQSPPAGTASTPVCKVPVERTQQRQSRFTVSADDSLDDETVDDKLTKVGVNRLDMYPLLGPKYKEIKNLLEDTHAQILQVMEGPGATNGGKELPHIFATIPALLPAGFHRWFNLRADDFGWEPPVAQRDADTSCGGVLEGCPQTTAGALTCLGQMPGQTAEDASRADEAVIQWEKLGQQVQKAMHRHATLERDNERLRGEIRAAEHRLEKLRAKAAPLGMQSLGSGATSATQSQAGDIRDTFAPDALIPGPTDSATGFVQISHGHPASSGIPAGVTPMLPVLPSERVNDAFPLASWTVADGMIEMSPGGASPSMQSMAVIGSDQALHGSSGFGLSSVTSGAGADCGKVVASGIDPVTSSRVAIAPSTPMGAGASSHVIGGVMSPPAGASAAPTAAPTTQASIAVKPPSALTLGNGAAL